jgi:hypothetical protein
VSLALVTMNASILSPFLVLVDARRARQPFMEQSGSRRVYGGMVVLHYAEGDVLAG